MIRPEQIRLVRTPGAGTDAVPADVIGHDYYGPDSVVQLRLRDGARMPLSARTFDVAVPDAGDVVGVVVSGPVAVYPLQDSGVSRVTRTGSLIALVACCAALAAGCGGGSEHSSITLYNGQHAELTSLLVAAFEKETGIKVQIRTNDSAVLADQIIQEGGASPGRRLHRGELSRADGAAAARAPRPAAPVHPRPGCPPATTRRQATGSAWRCGSAASSTTRRVVPRSQLPASLLDFAQPQWKGKIAIAPTDSDFPPLVGAVIATHGEAAARDWLAGLKRNARIYQDEEAVVAAVNRGDVA